MNSGQGHKTRKSRSPTVPGVYLYLLGEVVTQLGHDAAFMFEGLGIERERLPLLQTRVPADICLEATGRAVARAGAQGLSYAYARAARVTLHGALGMAILSSSSMQDVLELAQRYLKLRATAVRLEYHLEDDTGIVRIVPCTDFGIAEHFIMETLLLILAYTCEQLLAGQHMENISLHMPGAEPPYFAKFAEQLPVPVHYGAGHWEMRGPVSFIHATPLLADPLAAKLAREQCEQEFQEQFGLATTFSNRILAELQTASDKMPGVEQMADMLHMSSRTLKRRLQDEGLTYSTLVEAELKARACELLASTQLPISEIAYRLGYNDVSNFSRAFKRWTGLAASDYRKKP